MATTSTLASGVALAAATSIVKKILDDLYSETKQLGIAIFGLSRSTVRDAAVARALASTTKVKTLWKIETEVSLYDFYYPSLIDFSETPRRSISGLKDLPKQNFVVQGTAGQGKSIFLRYLCGQELSTSSTSTRLPIFIELRRLRSDHSILALILEALDRYKLPRTEEFWRSLAASGRAVLLLDGFDEIDPALVSRAVTDIEGLADLFRGELQLIITARPHSDIQRSSRFRVIRLSPLLRPDHSPFLRRICSDRELADNMLRVIRASPVEISELLTTPLMLTLLVILYQSIQAVPSTVPRFYEELFDVHFYRHDSSKPGFRRPRFLPLDDDTIKTLFAAFCFYSRVQGLNALTSDQFAECCARAARACKVQANASALKNELLKVVCLLQADGLNFSFVHESVAQYYTAYFVARSSDNFAEKFFAIYSTNSTWIPELRFLEQIDKYRYAKYVQLPITETIATELGVSFGLDSTTSADRIVPSIASDLVFLLSPDPLSPEEFGASSWNCGFAQRDLVRAAIANSFNQVLLDELSTKRLNISDLPSGRVEPVSFSHLRSRDLLAPETVERAALAAAAELRSLRENALQTLSAEKEKIDSLIDLKPDA